MCIRTQSRDGQGREKCTQKFDHWFICLIMRYSVSFEPLTVPGLSKQVCLSCYTASDFRDFNHTSFPIILIYKTNLKLPSEMEIILLPFIYACAKPPNSIQTFSGQVTRMVENATSGYAPF